MPSRHSSGKKDINATFPIWGTMIERNAVTRMFNSELASALSANSIPIVSLFDFLVDEGGGTRTEFFFDGVHLSQRAMPLALGELSGFLDGFDNAVLDSSQD